MPVPAKPTKSWTGIDGAKPALETLGFMGVGDKASSAGPSAWKGMMPEFKGMLGEEAWRLRENLSRTVSAGSGE